MKNPYVAERYSIMRYEAYEQARQDAIKAVESVIQYSVAECRYCRLTETDILNAILVVLKSEE